MLEIVCLYYRGCAAYDVLPDRLAQALEAENAQAKVVHRVVTAEEGQRFGMHGSPTVLINGADILGSAAAGMT